MNGYTTSSCLCNLHHPIEPSKLPFNWIHILDSQIFFDALCICAVGHREVQLGSRQLINFLGKSSKKKDPKE